MGWVYLINELDTNNYKIGVTKSKNVNWRRLELQTGNANELHICRTFESKNMYKLEGMLHKHYHKEHILGEWFVLNDDEALLFIETCQKYQNLINFLLEHNHFYKGDLTVDPI